MGKPDLQKRETTIRYGGSPIPETTAEQAASRFPVRRGGRRDIDIVPDPQYSEVFETK